MPLDSLSKYGKHSRLDHSLIAPPYSKQHERYSGISTHREYAFALKPHQEWRDWAQLSIKVKGILPIDLNTFSVMKAFSLEGNVCFIELYMAKNGHKDGNAKVRFSSPPHNAFWEHPKGKYAFQGVHGRYLVDIELLREKRGKSQVASPIRRGIYYDSAIKLLAEKIHFGIMIDTATMMPHHVVEKNRFAKIQEQTFEVDLLRHRINASFNVLFYKEQEYDRVNRFMLQIPFASLKKIQRMDITEKGVFALIISLTSPPQFFRKSGEEKAGHKEESLTWGEFDTWFRQTDIVYNGRDLQTKKVGLHKEEQPIIDIGRWTTYLFEFVTTSIPQTRFDEMKQALQDFNIEIETIERLAKERSRPAELWPLIDPPISQNASSDLIYLQSNTAIILPFEVRYQLEVCISHELLNEYNIDAPFIKKLAEISTVNLERARNILEWVAKEDQRIYEPMTLFDNESAMSASFKTEIPHYCAYSRKATITPTAIYFSSPTVETTNRVLRHYASENADGRFLRVQFTDEQGEGRINACAEKTRNDELFSRVFRTLFNGIRIGGRHYQFLAFGNSQFRENGAYFFCPTDHLSCNDIRQWMGNFSNIKVVAKHAARLGQCFSTTRAINGLSKPDLVRIPDVELEVGDKKYNFTDGVGKISPFLAQMITVELGVRSNVAPSAFQFRLGGAKGILVVWPDVKEREVHLRSSQEKFPAIYNGLEIIRCARFSTAALNRQTITILSSLGVPDNVFTDMLMEQLANYQSAMSNNELAVNLLLRYIDENSMTINIATMIRNGFMAERDPFVLSLLHLWRSWSIKLLKEKAKIIVEGGAFVLGCVDETNTLKGYKCPTVARGEQNKVEELPEVFIQVPDKEDPNKYNVVEGICLVGRNPSLHPGDIRVVRAVDVEALHHLRDVVVFPQNGERDIPSMCSGGDLDGDDFFVIWDENLLPREWNCDPMSYDAPKPRNLHRAVEITDLMKFFVRFMKNDTLPTIAHAHLALADFLDNGVKDQKCLELADLHSKAVDYVKTGEPAVMPKRLNPTKWPHFMEKKFKPKEAQYQSTKILGQLYDKVERVNFTPKYEEPFDKRILGAYKLPDSLLKSTRQVKTQYDTAIRRLMAQQEIGTEFEIWSTFVLSKPRVGSDYKLQEEIGRLSESLKEQFRAVCREKAGGNTFDVLGPFVAGMWQGGPKEKDGATLHATHEFPWLFEKELGRIATGIEIDDPQDSGVASLAGKSRRRQCGSGGLDVEDFVQQDNGVIVHRGEELDLFRHIDDSDDDSVSDDEARLAQEDHDFIMGESGEVILSTAFQVNKKPIPVDRLSGTGVEEVVPRTQMDGFINQREAAHLDYEPTDKISWHRAQHYSATNSRVIVSTRDSPVFDSSLERDLVKIASPNLKDPASDKLAPAMFPHVISPMMPNESNIPTKMEEELIEFELKESPLEKLTHMMDTGSCLSKDEVEAEEEAIELEIKESSFEKLARIMGSRAFHNAYDEFRH